MRREKVARKEGRNFTSFCSKFDLFKVSFSQRLDGGDKREVSSAVGVLLSILLLVLMGGYTAYKFDILINRKSNALTEMELRNFYGDDEKFTSADGLQVAFTVLA